MPVFVKRAYKVGPVPAAGLVILAVREQSYEVRMDCCGYEMDMLHTSLLRRIEKRKDNDALGCRRCKRNWRDPLQTTSSVAGAVLPKGWSLPEWPVPESLIWKNEWWGK